MCVRKEKSRNINKLIGDMKTPSRDFWPISILGVNPPPLRNPEIALVPVVG